MSQFLIYGLRCPESSLYKYIGKSSNGLSRPKSHLVLSSNQSVRFWVNELREEGLCPLIDVIEECSQEDLLDREKHWINYYHNSVSILMNVIEYKGINIDRLNNEIKAEEQKLYIKLNEIKSDIKSIKNIFDFVKYIRKQRGITQQTLSDLSGVGSRTIKQIELGKANPTYETLSKALNVLGYELKPSLIIPNKL
jgi:DNA-binding XRE family transcriptional regulator